MVVLPNGLLEFLIIHLLVRFTVVFIGWRILLAFILLEHIKE